MAFTVAIVGRPNVGKSTLFNRLVGKRLALVDDTPGVTRDRREHDAKLQDLRFKVIDTAGLEIAGPDALETRMRRQTEAAIADADVVLFLIDARAGVLPADEEFAALVRKAGKKVVLVANKAESRAGEAGAVDAWSLGLGQPLAFSAEHGLGLSDLRDAIAAAAGTIDLDEEDDDGGDFLPGPGEAIVDPDAEDEPEYDESKPLQVAVVGRPNAGKSTLVNALIGEDRMLTGPEAGITRDSISVDWEWRGRRVRLFDTAGMRRKARVQAKIERLAVADALRAIRFAEVVVLLFDATIPFEKQDLQIADFVVREGRAAVIAFSKWDLVEDPQARLRELRETADRLLPQIRGCLSVPISAETGKGLDRLLEAVVAAHRVWNRRISTGKLNRWLGAVLAAHPPPAVSGRRLKLRYITQAKTRPPGFVVSCSRPDAMPESYTRYLVNELRASFDMPGVPIRMFLRAGDNPYAGRARKKG
ncbi:MAG: ribosome biogenesis GTPase Der [Phyllobacteriaceae bacterium]|nr:ribosome biogenesis GTPase Der [Phyllobacteriaceae bacterium]